MNRRRLRLNGIEHDMLTTWRRVYHSDKGRSNFAKRSYRRRVRRSERIEIEHALTESE